jgi:hypothetical protein
MQGWTTWYTQELQAWALWKLVIGCGTECVTSHLCFSWEIFGLERCVHNLWAVEVQLQYLQLTTHQNLQRQTRQAWCVASSSNQAKRKHTGIETCKCEMYLPGFSILEHPVSGLNHATPTWIRSDLMICSHMADSCHGTAQSIRWRG